MTLCKGGGNLSWDIQENTAAIFKRVGPAVQCQRQKQLGEEIKA